MELQPAILSLQTGEQFFGIGIGAQQTAIGELCFNTGMAGYQEVFTDPSYKGQILTCTHVHIGNYGVHPTEAESGGVKIAGLIVKNFTQRFSRHDAEGSLENYLKANQIPAIAGIDTRQLVRVLRSQGATNAVITPATMDKAAIESLLNASSSMDGLELSSTVTTQTAYTLGDASSPNRIAAIDYGIKNSILQQMVLRGAYVKVFPCFATVNELLEFSPTGIFLSNGPGDPAAMPAAVETVRQLLNTNLPIFGICLGHQILARALGMSTYKMKYGHRGCNHPVKNLITQRCEVTSQNHGFAVSYESVANCKEVEVTHINLNDNTVEGLRLLNKPAFSVQYHPESSPGPHDSRYLFDTFFTQIKNYINNNVAECIW